MTLITRRVAVGVFCVLGSFYCFFAFIDIGSSGGLNLLFRGLAFFVAAFVAAWQSPCGSCLRF